MSPELRTPSDELTGVVYPIYFEPEHLSLDGADHHANHMAVREELQEGIGRALRLSRVEWTPDIFHLGKIPGSYHSFKGLEQGPELPDNEQAKFNLTLLYLAGVVPKKALDFRSKDPESYGVRDLSKKEHEFLSHPMITHPEKKYRPNGYSWKIRRQRLGQYLVEYALEQPVLEELAPNYAWKKLLNSDDEVAREEITVHIIKSAIDRAVGPVLPLYNEAMRAGMISADQPSVRGVIEELLPDHELVIYHNTLIESQSKRLLAAA